jgi:citrate lyase subunit alpha / citrate CoA-transferase
VDQLDAMLLGPAEVDLDFNVKGRTGSFSGLGGHADTPADTKLTLVTTRLSKSLVDRCGSRLCEIALIA